MFFNLRLDLENQNPIEIIDAIASWHEQKKTLTGTLVKFPQSPQISLDVYAIEVTTQGIKRMFTLVDFKDTKVFESITKKLADIWNNNRENIVSGRNMLIEPNITIQATGIINVVSKEQANPQILLDTLEDILIVNN